MALGFIGSGSHLSGDGVWKRSGAVSEIWVTRKDGTLRLSSGGPGEMGTASLRSRPN
jgi:hypothetical protein